MIFEAQFKVTGGGLSGGWFRVLTFHIEGPCVGPEEMIGMAVRHPLGRALSSTKQC